MSIGPFSFTKNLWAIKQSTSRSPEELLSYQQTLLLELVDFAWKHIPFYRQYWQQHTVDISKVRNLDDIRQLPLLPKDVVRASPAEDFLPDPSHRPKKLWVSQTSGSTGIPIKVYRSANTDAMTRAMIFYTFAAVGVKPTDSYSKILAFTDFKMKHRGLAARLGLRKYTPIPIDIPESEMMQRLNHARPRILYSYPSVLLKLADYARENGRPDYLKYVFAQGEMLPRPWRASIEDGLSAALYDTYGATEFPRLGFECAHRNGFHLFPQAGIVEVLRPDGSKADFEEEGEIVVTHLNNLTMPFIRYRIGDRGVLTARRCECGCTFPLLEQIAGRMDDFIALNNGRQQSARSLTHMKVDGVFQYRILQKSVQRFDVEVVPDSSFSEHSIATIRNEIQKACKADDLDVRVTTVEHIEISANGKMRIFQRDFSDEQ